MKRLILIACLVSSSIAIADGGTIHAILNHRIKQNSGNSNYQYVGNQPGTTSQYKTFVAPARNHVTSEYQVQGQYTCTDSDCSFNLTVPTGLGYVESITMFRGGKPGEYRWWARGAWSWTSLPGARCTITMQTAGGDFRNPVTWSSDTIPDVYWTNSSYNGITNAQIKHVRCTMSRSTLLAGFGLGYTWTVEPINALSPRASLWSEGYVHIRAVPDPVTITTTPWIDMNCTVGTMCPVPISWKINNPSNRSLTRLTIRALDNTGHELRDESGSPLTEKEMQIEDTNYTLHVLRNAGGTQTYSVAIEVEYD